MSRFPKHAVAVAALLTLVGAPVAQAQNNPSPAVGVTLNATKKETLSLSGVTASASLVSAGGIVDSSTANDFTPISVTTNWNLKTSTSVTLVGYFADPAQALVNGPDAITSAQVEGKLSTQPATSYAAFTGAPVGSAGVAGATLALWNQAVSGPTLKSNRTDVVNLRLNMTNAFAVAGDYAGTLNLRAIAQ
jgi:hypothetical protein